MTRYITGVSSVVLCGLFLCVFAAQSAVGAEAKNTTVYTCIKGGGAKDFSDAHCDHSVPNGTGEFGHTNLGVGEPTRLVVTNGGTKNNTTEASPAIIKGTVFGVATEVECKTVSGEAEIINEEPSSAWHRWKILNGVTLFSTCTVKKPALGCKVAEPIEFGVNGEGAEGLGAEKNEMGLEFKPSGAHFGSLKIEGCFVAGTFNVDGIAIATGTPSPKEKWSGATEIWTEAMTKETLKLAGNAASISSSMTVRMAPVGGITQNPIGYTTVT
jgi:hypothetical protein